MKLPKKHISLILIGAIIFIASIFRFYELDSIPPGLYPDVAVNGMDALSTLQSGNFDVFYQNNNGREGLIIWLDAWTMMVFGISIWALKFPAAVIGTLTVLGVYLLARQLFDNRKEQIALLAAFFTAVSFWHVNFSRIGFRAIMVPFFIAFSLYFLWKAFGSRRGNTGPNSFIWAIASGIFFGLGFYTYISFRLAVPLLFCIFGFWLVRLWQQKSVFVSVTATMLISAFFTALPIGIYFLQNPADFLGRAGQTSVLTADNPIAATGLSLAAHLAMFNFYGDQNWRHNYPPTPILFWPVGIFFFVGLVIAIKILWKSLFSRDNPNRLNTDSIAIGTLLLWFGFLLLPGILTIESIPHALRTIGVIPPVMIFAALGITAIYFEGQKFLKKNGVKKTGVIMLPASVLVIGAVLYFEFNRYFIEWGQNPNTQGAFTSNYVDIGNFTSKMNLEGWQTVVIANEDGVAIPYPDGIPVPTQTVMFAETAYCWQHASPALKKECRYYSRFAKPADIPHLALTGKTAIVLMKEDPEIYKQLAALFPQGMLQGRDNIKYFDISPESIQ